jgi:magnesium transporter
MSQWIALSELLGAPVLDGGGAAAGKVREVTLTPGQLAVTAFVVRTKTGDRSLPQAMVQSLNGGIRARTATTEWPEFAGPEGILLLGRDLLDQQIIDIHGRKVVRVNDVDFDLSGAPDAPVLRVVGVDVGARGAVRRLLNGVVPRIALRSLLKRIPPRLIPWEYVDLVETDPSRRIRLNIEHTGLEKLHPADIADIVEDLAPAEREALFESMDEEVAASALEEVDPKLQVAIVESLDSDRAAEIVEEMNPDAAADLLADLPLETSEEILDEMEPSDREEMRELLEFKENSAAGRMNTEFLSFAPEATVDDAIEALHGFGGSAESVTTLFVVDPQEQLLGSVPLSAIVLADGAEPLLGLRSDPLLSCPLEAKDTEVAELFDKYNLLALPVVDEEGRLQGVITADDVITLLRGML